MDRRNFLIGGTALGCSLAASPLVTPVAMAAGPWDNRLVVIVLRGGMDGLDALRPVGDPDYASLRPNLGQASGLSIDPFWSLHPALEPLLPLWQAGELGAVHATSTPYRGKRSHFDGQDILEAGSTDIDGVSDGWLNRMLGAVPGMTAEVAYAIGQEQMLILTGPNPRLRWSPQARLDMSPQARRLLELVLHDDPMFRNASLQAVDIADSLTEEALAAATGEDGATSMRVSPRGDHRALAQFAASRLVGDTRIASFSLNGWDTHNGQVGSLRGALGRLSETILTLKDNLGPVWGKTAVLCMTEFGRTARENGTKGTDHGTGGTMFYAGGALRGGQVLGRWPGLAEVDLLDARDLMPTSDVRAAAGSVMQGLFGLSREMIETTVFPGVDMSSAPRLTL
ncbi:DUF1501 domain-containing protein [Salipiger sp. IMCC34102]|uniref:DUF1501 domain-containing protein n=1 Tax=Salipiger sp. IMCC34102 TaxID=2510647 RepID=UPI00101CB052|nr:DUF1501 domain-containing protein [Salipiger sp. IMCC34102]RYH01911.1 DUF1501 domain-containing protein [Salipiger sp. IMCC34102]